MNVENEFIELIKESRYKNLVSALDYFEVLSKLMEIKIDKYITFHDQVEGDYGWNIFLNNVKFNLGYRNCTNNKMILSIDDQDVLNELENYLSDNKMSYKITHQEHKNFITININYYLSQELINKIITILRITFKII